MRWSYNLRYSTFRSWCQHHEPEPFVTMPFMYGEYAGFIIDRVEDSCSMLCYDIKPQSTKAKSERLEFGRFLGSQKKL